MVFTSFLLGAQHNKDSGETKAASLLVVSMGKAYNGMPPSLCGRQMVEPSSLLVVVVPVKLKTCKPSVSTNAVSSIYASSCIKLTINAHTTKEKINTRLHKNIQPNY